MSAPILDFIKAADTRLQEKKPRDLKAQDSKSKDDNPEKKNASDSESDDRFDTQKTSWVLSAGGNFWDGFLQPKGLTPNKVNI